MYRDQYESCNNNLTRFGRIESNPIKGTYVVADRIIDQGTEILSELPVACVPCAHYNATAVSTVTEFNRFNQLRLTLMEEQMLSFIQSIGVSFDGTLVMLTSRLLLLYLTSDPISNVVCEQIDKLFAANFTTIANQIQQTTNYCEHSYRNNYQYSYILSDKQQFESIVSSASIVKRLIENTIAIDSQLQSLIKKRITAKKSNVIHCWPISEDLCVQFLLKVGLNSFSLAIENVPSDCSERNEDRNRTIGIGLYLQTSQLNHHCNPNIIQTFEEKTGKISLRANRVIYPNEELCISYINCYQSNYCSSSSSSSSSSSRETGNRKLYWQRRTELLQSFAFICCCDCCLKERDVIIAYNRFVSNRSNSNVSSCVSRVNASGRGRVDAVAVSARGDDEIHVRDNYCWLCKDCKQRGILSPLYLLNRLPSTRCCHPTSELAKHNHDYNEEEEEEEDVDEEERIATAGEGIYQLQKLLFLAHKRYPSLLLSSTTATSVNSAIGANSSSCPLLPLLESGLRSATSIQHINIPITTLTQMNAYYDQSFAFPDSDVLYMQYHQEKVATTAKASNVINNSNIDNTWKQQSSAAELRYLCGNCFQEIKGEYFYSLIDNCIQQLRNTRNVVNSSRNSSNRSKSNKEGTQQEMRAQQVKMLQNAIKMLSEVLSDDNLTLCEVKRVIAM